MLYPKNIEKKLDFDFIREFLKKECLSPLGERFVDKMKFSSDFELVSKMVNQTYEFRKILSENYIFPSNHYLDATYCFQKIKPENSFLDLDDFLQLKLSLKTIITCLEFFNTNQLKFSYLYKLSSEIQLDPSLYHKINEIIDDEGRLKDNASRALLKIREEISIFERQLRRTTDNLVKKFKSENYTTENVEPTLRNGRIVIPIKSEYKRKIKGFIHDESATGQTTYIEPEEIFEINNSIKELGLQEKREIIRILTELTSQLRPHLYSLEKAYTYLSLIDFIRAKAKLAIEMEATLPEFSNTPLIQWTNARHPILSLSFKKQNKKVIPLTLHFKNDQKILLISGPNAGGKSVCLKTVGLIQYMFQTGLLVPLEDGSTMGFFKDMFIDIGDEQSLENDLSTYSAHLTNMKTVLQNASSDSLLLIDEFGTGTEPQFGAAIAESILERLNELKLMGVITTHYSNLKAYADKTEGMVNGSMAYNIDKLEPLYTLVVGKPGSSYALEIATKIGLSTTIIESSKQKLGKTHVDFDKLIQDLEKDKHKYNTLISEASKRERQLQQQLSEYTVLKNELESSKKTVLKEAKEKAKLILSEANQKIEATIREIKEVQADKKVTKEIRTKLEDYKETFEVVEEIQPVQVQQIKSPTEVLNPVLGVGDYVKVKDTGAVGQILELKEKEALISVGSLSSNVKRNRLIKISKKEFRGIIGEEFISKPEQKGFSYQSKMEAFSPILDVRGMRGEESLIEVTRFIDNALILHATDLKIVHGKGDGILRILIRKHLAYYKHIITLEDEHADRGGAGVTLIKTK